MTQKKCRADLGESAATDWNRGRPSSLCSGYHDLNAESIPDFARARLGENAARVASYAMSKLVERLTELGVVNDDGGWLDCAILNTWLDLTRMGGEA